MGSRDRRLYRELLYTALRYLPWMEEIIPRSEAEAIRAVAWLAADTPATHRFREALTGDWPPFPPTMSERARQLAASRELLPPWFRPHCPPVFLSPNLETLHAPGAAVDPDADRRPRRGARRIRRAAAAPGARPRPGPRPGRFSAEADLTATDAYRAGRFEIQDLGSQLILASAASRPAAAGSTPAPAPAARPCNWPRLLGPEGRVDAYDVRAAALAELRRRARRGGFANIRLTLRLPDETGVRRRAGGRAVQRQRHLAARAPPQMVHHAGGHRGPGRAPAGAARPASAGWCARAGGSSTPPARSAARRTRSVVAAFLAGRPDFAAAPPARAFGVPGAGPGLTILPAEHDTDGFFVASLRRAG